MNNANPTLTPQLVVMAIESGMLDDSLPALKASLNAREDILDKRAASSLDPGDEFLIKDCRPKKWNGELVRFKKHDGMWLVCDVVHRGSGMTGTVRLRTSHVGRVFKGGLGS